MYRPKRENTIQDESQHQFAIKNKVPERVQTFDRVRLIARKVIIEQLCRKMVKVESVRNVNDMIAIKTHHKNGVRREVLEWPMTNRGLCEDERH